MPWQMVLDKKNSFPERYHEINIFPQVISLIIQSSRQRTQEKFCTVFLPSNLRGYRATNWPPIEESRSGDLIKFSVLKVETKGNNTFVLNLTNLKSFYSFFICIYSGFCFFFLFWNWNKCSKEKTFLLDKVLFAFIKPESSSEN